MAFAGVRLTPACARDGAVERRPAWRRTAALRGASADDPDRAVGVRGAVAAADADGEPILEALQGEWTNVEFPEESYCVNGWRVTRFSRHGRSRFTVTWDRCRRQMFWGTHGRLRLVWVDINRIVWAPTPLGAQPWYWYRSRPRAEALAAPSPRFVPPPRTPPLPRMPPPPRTPSPPRRHHRWPAPSGGGAFGASAVSYGPRRRGGGSRGARPRQYRSRSPPPRRGAAAAAVGEAALPCGLTVREVSQLLFREITPEDYELLLRLDGSLPKKPAASEAQLRVLADSAGSEALGERCAVCLMEFGEADIVSKLPCGHCFHRTCVAKWLSEHRPVCPLCGAGLDQA